MNSICHKYDLGARCIRFIPCQQIIWFDPREECKYPSQPQTWHLHICTCTSKENNLPLISLSFSGGTKPLE